MSKMVTNPIFQNCYITEEWWVTQTVNDIGILNYLIIHLEVLKIFLIGMDLILFHPHSNRNPSLFEPKFLRVFILKTFHKTGDLERIAAVIAWIQEQPLQPV